MTSNQIHSKSCSYKDDYIEAEYMYSTCIVEENKKEGKHNLLESKAHEPSHFNVENITRKLIFRTEHSKGRLGVMLVGLSGNNASTMIAGIYANKLKLSWETKTGIKQPNYFGSMMLASTTKIGLDQHTMKEVFAPISSLLPLCHPENWVFGGWDINNASVGDAMRRAQVLDIQLQDQLYPYLKTMNPLPGVYIKDFIADNQEERANNILSGKLCEQLSIIRSNIRDFKKINNVDRVIVLWTATTEKFCSLMVNIHNLLQYMQLKKEKFSQALTCQQSIF
jgi:myo-inositol-1-phosphate synthase